MSIQVKSFVKCNYFTLHGNKQIVSGPVVLTADKMRLWRQKEKLLHLGSGAIWELGYINLCFSLEPNFCLGLALNLGNDIVGLEASLLGKGFGTAQ